ncbi:hypothetical protein [Actinomadura sp. 6N118]|uniref:WXG100-like domain-containing protein n=1 Tax=Actinomadura sp. 6N118 TaxID=3375151 RepID=UPI00378EACFE
MTKVMVDTDLVHNAAKYVASSQNALGTTWTTLAGALVSSTGMAGNPGTDQAAAKFVSAYQPAVQAAWRGFQALHRSTGDMSRGLTQTANNYTKADQHSVMGGGFSMVPQQQGSFRERILGFAVAPALSVPAPPPASGPGVPAPKSLLETLTGVEIGWLDVSEHWPTGNSRALAQAGTAWQTAQDSLVDARSRMAANVRTVTDHSDAPDIDAFGGYWSRLYTDCFPNTLLDGLPQLCAAIARACREYATAVQEAQTKVSGTASNPIAALAGAAAMRAALAEAAGKLLQTTGLIAVGALGTHLVTMVSTGAANAPNLRILEAELNDSVLREWNSPDDEPDPDDLEKDVGNIARELGYTEQEINEAIHEVKAASDWRGIGGNRNPDVMVDPESGEVYPQTRDGVGKDSLGNIFDHLPKRR